jgi:hypothetical protein
MVVFPALARPMIRTRKRWRAIEDFVLVSVVFLYPLLLGIRYWRETFVAGMPEMVEVMKNQDKRAGGEQCIVWLHVSQRSDVTHSLHAHSNF